MRAGAGVGGSVEIDPVNADILALDRGRTEAARAIGLGCRKTTRVLSTAQGNRINDATWKDRCIEGMHGRPALGAVAWAAGHSGAARRVGQQAGESALATT